MHKLFVLGADTFVQNDERPGIYIGARAATTKLYILERGEGYPSPFFLALVAVSFAIFFAFFSAFSCSFAIFSARSTA